jgi:hypothetical protein
MTGQKRRVVRLSLQKQKAGSALKSKAGKCGKQNARWERDVRPGADFESNLIAERSKAVFEYFDLPIKEQ